MTFQQAICPECGKLKPEDQENGHDTVHLDLDWRKADRPSLDDPIPKTEMCHECFLRIRDEFAPLAPSWDRNGVKHYPAAATESAGRIEQHAGKAV